MTASSAGRPSRIEIDASALRANAAALVRTVAPSALCAAVKANGFVALDDPKNLFGAQNVVPVITKAKATDTVKGALNAVSAKLDTDALATMVTKVVTDKQDASAVAAEWLKAQGLG